MKSVVSALRSRMFSFGSFQAFSKPLNMIGMGSSSTRGDVEIQEVPTAPFGGQKPGTSGLRQLVKVFEQANYLENFVQSTFDTVFPEDQEKKDVTLVVSGDGRYFNKEAATTIIRMCAANGVSKVIVGVNYLMSTPCVSHVIRSSKANGGFILTASHNPGGKDHDFGIKYNISSGGPAPEGMTDQIYKKTQNISRFLITKTSPQLDVSKPGQTDFAGMKIEVIDAPQFYADLMKSIFNFDALKTFVSRQDFSFLYDAMNGVAGPFAKKIFVDELGASADSLINSTPKEDFGGHHPDPNLEHAKELVERMGLLPNSEDKKTPDFGAAADGDADRNMIVGRRFFVTPSDSVAIIAANAVEAIPYFNKEGKLKGVARSMPTSAALDRVATKLGVDCYEVPTGWKFFGNLMDAGKLSICGEESFGTGSDHIREKDGIWAVLAWLSILESKNREKQQLVSVEDIVVDHWKTYGRNFYTRYDYENVSSESAQNVMKGLLEKVVRCREELMRSPDEGPVFGGAFQVKFADEFSYTDPVDKSVSNKQGIRFIFTDGSRIVYRLSGTGSVGATIRVYIEKYEGDASKILLNPKDALGGLISVALELSKVHKLTGREKPDVIT